MNAKDTLIIFAAVLSGNCFLSGCFHCLHSFLTNQCFAQSLRAFSQDLDLNRNELIIDVTPYLAFVLLRVSVKYHVVEIFFGPLVPCKQLLNATCLGQNVEYMVWSSKSESSSREVGSGCDILLLQKLGKKLRQ